MSKKNKKAFVDGVNILDSNPKAYKYVKKKIKSAGDGEKLDLTPLDLDTLYKKYKEVGNNRYMDTLLLRQVDNLLRKRKMGKPQRLAIFVTAGQEGSTIKSHGNGAAGLVGWRGTRAENLPSTVEGQADKIYNETYGLFSNDNWNHGGLGSGYKTAREALLAFLNATTPEEAIRALNFGYVRPPKSETLYRINLMKKLYKKGGLILKAQKGTVMQWLSNNSDLVKGGLSLLGNGLSTIKKENDIQSLYQKNLEKAKALNKADNAEAWYIANNQAKQIASQLLKLNKVEGDNSSDSKIVLDNLAANIATEIVNNLSLNLETLKPLLMELARESIQGSGSNNIGNIFSNLAEQLGLYLGKQNSKAPSITEPMKNYAKDFKQKTNPSINNMNFKVAMAMKDPTYRLPNYTLPSISDYKFSWQK